jgi:hypothetical protein
MTSLDLRPRDPGARRLLRSVGAVEPDPLFRRRLRGRVLNQHVAAREGLARPDVRPRRMGRLGRSVLMASLALAVSVGGAAAASQQALPGDLLYPMKLQVEEIRLRAAPAWMREGLELAALDERLDEVEQLAAADRWADLAVAVDAALAARQELHASDPVAEVALEKHTAALEELLTVVPEAGRSGIERALQASEAHPHKPALSGRGATPAVPNGPGERANPATPASPTHPPQPTHPPEPTTRASSAPTSPPAQTDTSGRGQSSRSPDPTAP